MQIRILLPATYNRHNSTYLQRRLLWMPTVETLVNFTLPRLRLSSDHGIRITHDPL